MNLRRFQIGVVLCSGLTLLSVFLALAYTVRLTHKMQKIAHDELQEANRLNLQVNHDDRHMLADQIKAEIRKLHQAFGIDDSPRELPRQNTRAEWRR